MDVGVDECVLRPLVHSQIIFDNAEAGDDATARADVDDLFVIKYDARGGGEPVLARGIESGAFAPIDQRIEIDRARLLRGLRIALQ